MTIKTSTLKTARDEIATITPAADVAVEQMEANPEAPVVAHNLIATTMSVGLLCELMAVVLDEIIALRERLDAIENPEFLGFDDETEVTVRQLKGNEKEEFEGFLRRMGML